MQWGDGSPHPVVSEKQPGGGHEWWFFQATGLQALVWFVWKFLCAFNIEIPLSLRMDSHRPILQMKETENQGEEVTCPRLLN